MRKWGEGKEIKCCLKCNKEFIAWVCQKRKCCSKSCASSLKPKIYLRIWKKCQECDVDFEVKLYREKTALYCSVSCRQKNMPAKECHPNWKGGIARTWKSKVLIKRLIKERQRCEICLSSEKLQGHHVIPYSENKELQEDESNIQILCILCHARKHPEMTNFILKGEYHE